METSKLMELFVQYVAPVLLTAIASGLTWLLTQLALVAKTRFEASKWGAAMDQLALLAKVAVVEVETTLRPLVKEVTADGRVTPEEAAKLKKAAVDKLLEMAKARGFEEAKKLLESTVPAVGTLVSGFVESAVAAQKAPLTLAVGSPVPVAAGNP
jgi:hypothetical protein